MSLTMPETLLALAHSRARIDSLLRQTEDPAQRASNLTALLRELWPSSALYGCLLRVDGQSHGHARDGAGQPRPEWVDVLRKKLAERAGSQGKATARVLKLPRSLKLPDQTLAVEEITFADCRWGTLTVAVPAEASLETNASARVLLAVSADQLAVRLHGEEQARALQSLRAELAAQTWLANVGELAGPVVHGINNFLNVVSLHIQVLEPEVSEAIRSELAEILHQGTTVATVVKHFQQFRQPSPPRVQPLDLNQLVREAREELTHARTEPLEGPEIHLILASDLPPWPGPLSDVKRLLTFLLRSASSAVLLEGGSITVRTELAAACVRLRIEDTGPTVPSELLRQMFESEIPGRGAASNLELAASKSLVRRLHGQIKGENQPEGGVAVTVELPLT